MLSHSEFGSPVSGGLDDTRGALLRFVSIPPLVPSYKTSRHRPRDCGPSCRRFCSHVHRARVVDPDIPNIRAGHFPGTAGIGTGLAAHRPDTPSRTRNAEHGAIGILTGTMGITFSVALPIDLEVDPPAFHDHRRQPAKLSVPIVWNEDADRQPGRGEFSRQNTGNAQVDQFQSGSALSGRFKPHHIR